MITLNFLNLCCDTKLRQELALGPKQFSQAQVFVFVLFFFCLFFVFGRQEYYMLFSTLKALKKKTEGINSPKIFVKDSKFTYDFLLWPSMLMISLNLAFITTQRPECRYVIQSNRAVSATLRSIHTCDFLA